jgi:glycosyltransferase involved in cell wall biosynthesis
MDVGFVSNVVYPHTTGGAEKRIYEIARRLAADGHSVTQYSRRYWESEGPTHRDGVRFEAIAPGRELYSGDRRSIPEAVGFGVRSIGPLRRLFQQHDIVHASVFPYFPVLGAALARATAGPTAAPLVTTWHEVWDEYWEEYLGRLAPFGKLVERATGRVAQHPIAISELTAGRLERLGQPAPHIVPNGIDVEGIRSVDPASDGFTVLYAGRLIPEKSVGLAISAFERLAATRPDITFGIVGEGPERRALQAQAAETACADRIEFLGFLEEHRSVLAQMQAAEVFCSPSEREGFGITYLEALAAGCIVVGADHEHSAASEVIGDGGLVVEPTERALVEALERALERDTDLDPEQQAAAFDWDRIADRTLSVYQSALQSGTGGESPS